MMKHEFEKLAGRTVTAEQFDAIEKLYTDSELNKYEFVKSIRAMLKSIPQQENENKKTIIMIGIKGDSGFYATSNGWRYHTKLAELIGVNIATGQIQVKIIENSYDTRCKSHEMEYIRDCEVEFV